LTIAKAGDGARSWHYAGSSGLLQFAIAPSSRTATGRWMLRAACAPIGGGRRGHATTSIRVRGRGAGDGFLAGRKGPAFRVHVRDGTVLARAKLPLGGLGGDPGNDYPWTRRILNSGFDPWGEYYRECTSFVAWALHLRNGYDMPFHADADRWALDAASRGVAVNSTPAVGAVAWEQKPPFGHVAWVRAVRSGMVTVEEYNEHGNGTYDVRTVPARAFEYIHFKDLSDAPVTIATPTGAGPTTYAETAGSVANTWTDYADAGGTEGSPIAKYQTVQITCKVAGFKVADGNTAWYRIASSPWSDVYYVSADAFYNDDATSGSLSSTPFVDGAVPDC
jgi:surface antigen